MVFHDLPDRKQGRVDQDHFLPTPGAALAFLFRYGCRHKHKVPDGGRIGLGSGDGSLIRLV